MSESALISEFDLQGIPLRNRVVMAPDLISFGRPFTGNLDLVRRFIEGLPLAETAPPGVWYTPGAEGYTDYPVHA